MNNRLLFALLFILLKNIYPQEDTTEIVFYGGKRIFYYPKEELVILLDSSFVRYALYEVKACSIVYDLKKQILQAYKKSGEVIFSANKETIIGKELHFNLHNKKGMMKKAKTKVKDGFFYADEIWLIREKVLHAINCRYTTCEAPCPHYHFSAKKVKILIDDMAIVEPISLHFFNFKSPFIVAPFWFFPIGEKRKSGLLPFRVGRSKEEGFYFKRVAYYLVINEHSDLTFYLDIMQKKGLMPKIEGIYDYSPKAFGRFNSSFIKEGKRNRFSINLLHQSKFLFKTDLGAKIDYQSDARFIQDYAEERIEWLKKEVYSTINIKKNYRHFGQLNINLENRKDFADNINQFLLPGFYFGFISRPLIKNVLNFSPSIKFDNFYQMAKDTIKNYEQRISGNLGLSFGPKWLRNFYFNNSLTYKKRKEVIKDRLKTDYLLFKSNTNFGFYQSFFNTLNISENFGYYQEFKFLKDKTEVSSRYPISVNCALTLYRIFLLNIFSLKGFLHTIVPNISFNYEPQVKNITPDFKEKPKSLSLNFNILNNFNIKYYKKGEEIKRDFLIFSVGSSYNFLDKKLLPISINGEVRIFQEKNIVLNSFFSFLYDIERFYFKASLINSLSWEYQIPEIVNLNIKVFHRFFKDAYNVYKTDMMIQTSGNLNIKTIRFTFSSGYNVKEKRATDYSIALWKDLHCWEGIFNFSKFGALWRYDFKFRIKKIPEVSIGKDIFGFLLR